MATYIVSMNSMNLSFSFIYSACGFRMNSHRETISYEHTFENTKINEYIHMIKGYVAIWNKDWIDKNTYKIMFKFKIFTKCLIYGIWLTDDNYIMTYKIVCIPLI